MEAEAAGFAAMKHVLMHTNLTLIIKKTRKTIRLCAAFTRLLRTKSTGRVEVAKKVLQAGLKDGSAHCYQEREMQHRQ